MISFIRFAAHVIDRAIVGAGPEWLTPVERVELAEAESIMSGYGSPVIGEYPETNEIETCIDLSC